ncbi:exodeoxyribonuclease III [Desulfurispira natronophila]|nr:exodeoxyribonuclease III [Desulfurispira natronophila]
MHTFVTFNINGIRAHWHQLEELLAKYQPWLVGLQETKVVDELFPVDALSALGYHCEFHGQKGHYGVALISRDKPLEVQKNFPAEEPDAQRRMIAATYSWGGTTIHVINGYFPQGESRHHPTKFPAKRRYYQDLCDYLDRKCDPEDPVVVMGDMNVAPGELDVGIGDDNARRWLREGKCCFLPEEREWLHGVMEWGLHDGLRHLHPKDPMLSWFDYRSRGFQREPRRGLRIDHILLTAPVFHSLGQAGVDYDIRAMERPSDHCPVWVALATP